MRFEFTTENASMNDGKLLSLKSRLHNYAKDNKNSTSTITELLTFKARGENQFYFIGSNDILFFSSRHPVLYQSVVSQCTDI